MSGVSSAGPRTVVHVINTGGPGGAETVCVNLMTHADRARWRPVAVVPDRGWIYRALVDAGVETHVLGHRTYADLPGYLISLARIVRGARASVVHSHLFGPSFVASLLGVVQRVAVVGTIHGEGDLDPNERFRRAKFAVINHGAARLVFVSEALRAHFLATGLLREDMTTVIPNGVDVARYGASADPGVRRALGAGPDDFLVGAVGNYRAAKGHDVLLRAAAIVRARGGGCRFVVVGHGNPEVEAELHRLRRELHLDDAFTLSGFREDVPAVMAALDVYALTSRSEGFSISTVEAMASSRPVVATRCGGPEYILEDGRTGLLVENGSPDAVADALERLRGDAGLRARLGAAARRSAEARFGVEPQVRAYEATYDDAVARRAGAATRPPTTMTMETLP